MIVTAWIGVLDRALQRNSKEMMWWSNDSRFEDLKVGYCESLLWWLRTVSGSSFVGDIAVDGDEDSTIDESILE